MNSARLNWPVYGSWNISRVERTKRLKVEDFGKMPKPNKTEKVSKEMQPRFEEITQFTDAFSDAYLNAEWKTVCRQLTAVLCRKRPSPVASGNAGIWAAGVV